MPVGMKRIRVLAEACGIILSCAACDRMELPDDGSIRFRVTANPAKASMSETTTVDNFLVSGYKTGTMLFLFENSVTVQDGSTKVVAGYCWPEWNMDFYAAFPVVQGQKIDFDTSSKTASIKYTNLDGSQDFVTAISTNTSPSSAVALTFRHVLSNFENLSLRGSLDAVSFFVKSVKLSLPQSARYNFNSDTWSELGNVGEKPFVTNGNIFGTASMNVVENYSLVPGTYDLTVEYSVIANGISRSYVKTAEVNFMQGHKTTVNGVLTNDLTPVNFTVTVEEWEQNTEEIVL